MSEVKLIGITKPNIDGVSTAEDLVAYCARVSNPTNQINSETAPKLLRYLMKNKHWSPFEMVHMVVGIKTTRDIARQILRHRSFSFQEFSQRYAVADGFELREARLQDQKNRQNSIITDDEELKQQWQAVQQRLIEHAKASYDWALENGIAKEQARSVLPEGNTQSTLYMSGTLRSFWHYCELRCGNGTQLEHQEIANKIWEIVCQEFPAISDLIHTKE